MILNENTLGRAGARAGGRVGGRAGGRVGGRAGVQTCSQTDMQVYFCSCMHSFEYAFLLVLDQFKL